MALQLPGEFVATVTVTELNSKTEADLSSALASCVKLKIAPPINRSPKTTITILCKIFIDKFTEIKLFRIRLLHEKIENQALFIGEKRHILADCVISIQFLFQLLIFPMIACGIRLALCRISS